MKLRWRSFTADQYDSALQFQEWARRYAPRAEQVELWQVGDTYEVRWVEG